MTSQLYDTASEPTAAQLVANLQRVLADVATACSERDKDMSSSSSNGGGNASRDVCLVAVSKTKSPACVQALYDAGHRVFGENYVHELTDKARVLPRDIQWHFIGHLQSNKIKELLTGTPNLAVVETVDSVKLASKLNDGVARYRDGAAAAAATTATTAATTTAAEQQRLAVYVQVNTSGEESKSGVAPGDAAVALAQHIAHDCPHLHLQGLMTIGMPDFTSTPANFACLVRCRDEVAHALHVSPDTLALSMGMSGDFVNAIRMGATSVRVGSTIFGQRYYANKPSSEATTQHNETK